MLSITPQGETPWRLIGITGNQGIDGDETLYEIDVAGARLASLDGWEGALPDQSRFPGAPATVVSTGNYGFASPDGSSGALRVEVPNIPEGPYYWGARSPNVVAPLAAGAESLSFDMTLLGHELNGGSFGVPWPEPGDNSFDGFAQSRALAVQLPGPNGWVQRDFSDETATDSMTTGAQWSGRDGTRSITWDLTKFTSGGMSIAEYIAANNATDVRIWLVAQGWDNNGNQGPMRFYFDNIVLHGPAGDTVIGDFDAPELESTLIAKLPHVPDTDSIAYNPDDGLLWRASGAESYRDQPNRKGFHDNQAMQTIDLNAAEPLTTQRGIYNANYEGEIDEERGPTGPYGVPGPFPTFVVPDHRRADDEADATGPNEYHALRDFTWSATEKVFYASDENGLFRITPTGTVTKVGPPAVGLGGMKGITFFTVNGERRLLVSERGDEDISDTPAKLWTINPADGTPVGDPVEMFDPAGNPVTGILSLIETPDGELLGIGRSNADVGDPFLRSLVSIDPVTGTVTTIGTFDVHMADLAAFIPRAAPAGAQVTRVFVGGPDINGPSPTAEQAAFRTAAGVDPIHGFPVPGGADQVRAMPWIGGISSISIRFSQDVAAEIAQGDLVVRGSANATYATSGFGYDPATRTARWTLAGTPVTRDKLRLVLDDALLPSLDGEWTNPAGTPPAGGDAYPSGDGTTGGDFNFRVNVLAGDATGDGIVSALDVADVKRRLSRRAGDGSSGTNGYSIFTDVNGDGIISALDLAAIKQRLTRRIDDLAEPASLLLFA